MQKHFRLTARTRVTRNKIILSKIVNHISLYELQRSVPLTVLEEGVDLTLIQQRSFTLVDTSREPIDEWA
jgi:hypothetical protein